MAKKFIIIIFLLLLIISPRVIAGLNNEKIAQQAAHSGEFEKAAAEYEMAALRLFWRGDLWSELGSAKLLSGQKEDALIAFRIAKEKGALSAFGWDFLGLENWQKGNLEMALIIWREGLVFHPDFAKFYSRLAVAYREKGDYASEKDALIRWLRLEDGTEKKAPYHYRLGLLFFLDSPEKALGELSSALRADSEFAPVVDTLRTSLNLALLESDPALSNILLGRGLALAEEWELAAEIFTRVTQDYPTNASAWAWLGEAKEHLDENALSDLDRALNLNPNSALVHSLRGLYWQRRGDFVEAIKEFRAAVKLEPENPNLYTALGEVYAHSGDSLLALEAYEQATSLAPDNPFYWQLLALFSTQYLVELEEIGLAAAKKAVALSPTDAEFVDTLGQVYFRLEEDEEAEKQFLFALVLDPSFGAAHLHLGIFHLKHNHLDLAYQSLLQARDFSHGTLIEEQALRLLSEYFKK